MFVLASIQRTHFYLIQLNFGLCMKHRAQLLSWNRHYFTKQWLGWDYLFQKSFALAARSSLLLYTGIGASHAPIPSFLVFNVHPSCWTMPERLNTAYPSFPSNIMCKPAWVFQAWSLLLFILLHCLLYTEKYKELQQLCLPNDQIYLHLMPRMLLLHHWSSLQLWIRHQAKYLGPFWLLPKDWAQHDRIQSTNTSILWTCTDSSHNSCVDHLGWTGLDSSSPWY